MSDYRFSGFSFDTDSLELTGDSGPVPLEPQVFQLLQFLIENRDRVVSKDEIIDAVWDGRIVSDTALNTRIAAVRRALGDDGKTQAIIRTFPRRGFRFVAALSESEKPADTGQPLQLPDKPSIAVLPFNNLSGDPEQEYFADGIAEDIITALSRFGWFFVIARNSSFSYKGTSPDIRRIAQELGVQYVLEGSVRKAANRVRVTAQLIDALTGRHIWAERYDRELTDIFGVQDEITSAITGAVAPSFVSAEARRVERKVPESFDAWDYAIRGNWHLWRLGKEHLTEAKRLFQAAIELDPRSSMALSGLAMVYSFEVVWGWTTDPAKSRDLADEMAQRAVAADNTDAWAQAMIGNVLLHKRQNADSIAACRRALDLNPNLALAESLLALGHGWSGDYDDAVLHADRAARLSPRDPTQAWCHLARIAAAFVTGRYNEQVEWARKITAAVPDHPSGWRMLAVGCAYLDRMEEAQAAIQQLLRLVPHITIDQIRTFTPGVRPHDIDRFLEGLRKAGLPEK